MPDDTDALKPGKTDDEADDRGGESPSSSGGTSARGKTSKAKPAPVKSKARSRREEEEEEDDEDLDDEDDEDLDDEDDEPPPPPRKSAKSGGKGAKAVPARAPARKVSAKASRKAAARVPRKRLPPRPVSYYLPFSLVGMGIIALHVFWDVQFAPVAVLGIAVVIWSYMGIGSATEVS